MNSLIALHNRFFIRSARWIAFDDKNVEPYDVNDLEKDCFGGKYTVDVYDNFSKTTAPQVWIVKLLVPLLFYSLVCFLSTILSVAGI